MFYTSMETLKRSTNNKLHKAYKTNYRLCNLIILLKIHFT